MSEDNARQAGELLAEVLGDGMTAGMEGGGFTCSEADKIATALLLLGQPGAARSWLRGHAEGDTDPDDEHRVEEGEVDTESMIASHVQMLASTHGIVLHDELDVPDDLADEPPANSRRTGAHEIEVGQHVKVWAFTSADPWPMGRAGFHEGVVTQVYSSLGEYQKATDEEVSGVPTLHITFADGTILTAVHYAVTYIVNES